MGCVNHGSAEAVDIMQCFSTGCIVHLWVHQTFPWAYHRDGMYQVLGLQDQFALLQLLNNNILHFTLA